MTEVNQRQTDENLMLAFANDDDMQSFSILFNRYDKQLVNFVSKQLSCRSIAQDICQETWYSIINSKRNYQPSATFKTYIYHILHNKLIDYYRKQSKNPLNLSYNVFDSGQHSDEDTFLVDESSESDPLDGYNKEQIKLILDKGLEQLSLPDREILVFRYLLQLSVVEIADILGIKKEACKSRIRYAKQKLKKICEKQKTDILSLLQ